MIEHACPHASVIPYRLPMRILIASKFWYPRGGLERVMFDEIAWLEGAGHVVAHFSTSHPDNQSSPWSDYFVPYMDLGEHASLAARERVVAMARMFYSVEAAKRFRRLLVVFRPHVVHVHGIHRQLSPSILFEARRAGIPVVQTLHDYHPVCPSDTLLRGGNEVCVPPQCRGRSLLPCVVHRCVRGSVATSAASAAELFWRRWVMGYADLVALFIAPSHYLADIIRSGGWNRPSIAVLPNAVPGVPDQSPSAPGDFFLYTGRLSREKGVATLLSASIRAKVPLIVAGDGPQARELRGMAPATVRFVGHVAAAEVAQLLHGCLAAVVPSQWPENAPMAVLEPMAAARPVVATCVGGIPELVRDGIDGVLVAPGDVSALATALLRVASDRELACRLGRAGRERVLERFTPAVHLQGLLEAYRRVALPVVQAGRGGVAPTTALDDMS
jgi:glycosyltransferase involved in cell wall biosynthesis